MENNDIMVITRYDKEEVVFYNNKEYELEVDEGEGVGGGDEYNSTQTLKKTLPWWY